MRLRHIFTLSIKPHGTKLYFMRIRELLNIAHCIRSHILPCTPREAIDKSKITLIHPLGGNPQKPLWGIRNIVLRIFSRIIIGIGIYSKNREIASMARPHPVVSITTKLSNRRRGSSNKTHIFKCSKSKKEILISIEKGLYIGTHPLSFTLHSLNQPL